MTKPTPIKILRDTGASQSIILSGKLPFSEKSYTGNNVLIKGVGSEDYSSIQLHNVYIWTDLVEGPFQLGVRNTLPFDGIDLILGNDLAGDKVKVQPILTNTPIMEENFKEEVNKIPGLYPACAITRAMAKKQKEEEEQEMDIDLADSIVGKSLAHDRNDNELSTMSDALIRQNINNANEHENGANPSISTNLLEQQREDPEILPLFENALSEAEAEEESECFFIQNNILMRKYRPPRVPAEEDGEVFFQIVVPKKYQREILSIAHESPLSGHLGVTKTHQKILKHFYWPKLKQDVASYLKTCHTCQMTGKPNQKIPKAPLKPIPAFKEPFSHLIIDCVGPLDKSKSGNQYILTIMCASTRFPEAIPLRNIRAKNIIKHLIKFFTTFGLPNSIQSDQGSNFTSGYFEQKLKELDIRHIKSSAYHPESQGAIERFHQTLKSMLKKYCIETGKDWDEGLPLVLFAARDALQESLGFSPFELVFGHEVKGPLALLKDKFIENKNKPTGMLKYVLDFKERIYLANELAHKNLKAAQIKMKTIYDKNTKMREFQVGDQVLVYLPIPGKALQPRYCGPYVIDKKLNDYNYIVNTHDRKKSKQLCHINLLKPYHSRDNYNIQVVNAVSSASPEDANEEDGPMEKFYGDDSTHLLNNSDILNNLDEKLEHLGLYQREELKCLIKDFKELFPDVPSQTTLIEHDVDVGEAQPIRQHPYRVNPEKRQILRDEIKFLLENDIIEPSNSNWSSPCILVPKPDGSYRMCTDYRKVNDVTKTDSFPLPRIDDLIDRIGHSKFITKFDLLKGFYQVPLTDRAKEISAFVTPDGLYQYKRMPFGMKNSPSTFQRLVNMLIYDIDNCDIYIDDAVIYTNTWEDHLTTIKKLFKN